MRDQPSGGIRWLALLAAMWMILTVVVASPAWADDNDDDDDNGHGHSHHSHHCHDHDDDDDCSTTTTTTPPTTSPPVTAIPPATTTPPTTAPPARAPATTTTTTPPTTTTTAVPVPPDPQWEEQRLETSDPSSTTTTNPSGYESKESLVLTISSPSEGDNESGQGETGDDGFHILPREGLTVVFRSAVETIESQLILATVLGILIAALTSVGIDKRR